MCIIYSVQCVQCMPCVKGVQVYNCVTVHSGLRCPHFMQIKLRTGFGVQECVQCANCANFDRKLLHLWVITRELHKRLKRRLFTPRGYESTHESIFVRICIMSYPYYRGKLKITGQARHFFKMCAKYMQICEKCV